MVTGIVTTPLPAGIAAGISPIVAQYYGQWMQVSMSELADGGSVSIWDSGMWVEEGGMVRADAGVAYYDTE